MKSIQEMNNVEKGKLLADLFPNELQGILDIIPVICKTLTDNAEELEEKWDNGLISFNWWCKLALSVNERVQKEGKHLLKSRRFADQLFDGYNALFTIDSIVKYADKEKSDTRFHYMVKALFIGGPN